MINVGIIGYGFMGHIHCKNLQTMEGYKVVAVCDNVESQLADVPEGIKTYAKAEDLIADDAIDTCIVVVPNQIHLEMVEKVARAGKNVICEKPAALSVAEFDRMMEIVRECGVPFTVHQQRRWDKDFRTAKEVYDKKMVGQVYTVQSKLYGFNGNMHDWHIYPEMGGGMLYDWGVHLIDQMLWMIHSEIESVYADLRNVINEKVDDYFKIMIRFANGVVGEIELGTYFLADRANWFERHWFVGGDKGSMYLDGFSPEGKIVRTTELLTNVEGQPTMTAAGPTRSFGPPPEGRIITEPLPAVDSEQTMYFENYAKALAGEEEFIVKPEEVRRVLQFMEMVRESAATGKSVSAKQVAKA